MFGAAFFVHDAVAIDARVSVLNLLDRVLAVAKYAVRFIGASGAARILAPYGLVVVGMTAPRTERIVHRAILAKRAAFRWPSIRTTDAAFGGSP